MFRRFSPIRVLLLAVIGLAIVGLMTWPTQLIAGGEPAAAQAQMKGQLENAVALRIAEIHARFKELAQEAETAGKTAAIVNENRALEAELSKLQPQGAAGPTPVVTTETEPNNTSGTANPVNVSPSSQPCAVVSGAINPAGDADFFSFTAPAGSKIWILADTGGTQNAGANSRDSFIDLLASDGATVIESDDDDGTGNGGDGTVEATVSSIIGGRTLAAGGTYFIRVTGFGSADIINPYRLFVVLTNAAAIAEVEANDTAATANPIVAAGSPIGLRSGAISPGGDIDYYSVVATAGNIVYFNADADPERDGAGSDLVVEFRSPADALLLTVDSSVAGSLANPAAEGANFTITTPGTYFVKVRNFSASGTGTYNLMVSSCSGDPVGGTCDLLTCPANITRSNDPNQCGAVVNYPPPTSNGGCEPINCSPASGSFFPVGTTTVTCTSSGTPTCTFIITVNDAQPPALTCPADIIVPVTTSQCSSVVNYTATASDNCPGVMLVCNPPSGSTFPVGTTTVTCTATDASGNTATCAFTVKINDTQPPVITCPPNITAIPANVNDACTVVNFTTTASDNCAGMVVICNPPSGSCFPVGVTTITCTATDATGNVATCSFTISVFNGRLQDEFEACNNSVLFNTITGDYRWCCHGTIFTGRGKVTKSGNTFTLEHNASDRKVLMKLSAGSSPP
ncbi:MAG TPA: HYR domain-containing protein, partial [Blastocatellia bacterium]|nr:HYR domain-containing protein [Blastocatellia bacterium]